MKRVLSLILITCLCTISLLGNPGPANAATWEQDYSQGHLYYTSASLVTALNGDVSSISPAIDDSKIPYGTAESYLRSTGPLGIWGPLSARGPLGILGPLGNNTWNPDFWISGCMDWSEWSKELTGMGGPLSELGPLGETGPLGDLYYNSILFDVNDFARHLRALGVWSVLGPIGPLGAVGPLGPLGPVGAHGCIRNSNGEYTSNGKVVRNVTIWYDKARTSKRTYELYENYTESFAKAMTDNDTSFMVEGTASMWDDTDTYTFTSHADQLVTVLVVPTQLLWADDFDLIITDQYGNELIRSDTSGNWIEWVQMKVPAGTTLQAKVHLASPLAPGVFTTYRLFVTGSTPYVNKTEITGDHIAVWR